MSQYIINEKQVVEINSVRESLNKIIDRLEELALQGYSENYLLYALGQISADLKRCAEKNGEVFDEIKSVKIEISDKPTTKYTPEESEFKLDESVICTEHIPINNPDFQEGDEVMIVCTDVYSRDYENWGYTIANKPYGNKTRFVESQMIRKK